MSKNIIDPNTFNTETTRLDALRAAAIFQSLGGLGLSSTDAYEEFSDLMNSVPEDGLSALYALSGQPVPDGLTDVERAEDAFDGKVARLFDAEQTFGYHFLSAEVGRLTLTSEETIYDSDGRLLPHSILMAKTVNDRVELLKFRQQGPFIETIEIFPEDWKAMDDAVTELGRVNSLIEEGEA